MELSQFSTLPVPVSATGAARTERARAAPRRIGLLLAYPAAILLAAAALVFGAEAVLRGSAGEAAFFLVDPSRPGPATVAIVALALMGADALLRRGMQSALVLGPLLVALAWIGREKLFYLGDPPYPADFLYARQIAELMPLMAAERPVAGVLMIAAGVAGAVLVAMLWRWSRLLPPIGIAGRAARLAIALPLLGHLAAQMDHASHSTLRSQLGIQPMMWDQKANYAHNGLVLAFALNVPMANVAAPSGYSAPAMEASARGAPEVFVPARRPDIIMVMSESLWDPKRLPGTALTPDPLAFIGSAQSGHVFSPEFGGMTANVEFEALTGFSNAMLPYGSIPYQQYVRGEMPSLASFLGGQGYATLAVHPFQGWFWNRTNVYRAFGFDRFLSEETMEPLDRRGRLAADAALTELIIAEADASEEPLFLFAVTLQNHGPYEAGRYPDARIEVETAAGEAARAAIATFAEGMMDSDRAFERLIEWARARERETVVVFFGDHLPPLGPTWMAAGFMETTVSDRFGAPAALLRERETPLVVWSNRKGTVEDIGTVSPAFLPLHALRAAGIEHPFYTGLLGELHDSWRVIDRHVLIDADGAATAGWSQAGRSDRLIEDYRLIQYDIMFGSRYGEEGFFPAPADLHGPAT